MRLFVVVLTLLALFLPVNLGLAQEQMQKSGKGPQPEVPFRSPNNVMKMHSITNAQRRAAAKRLRTRRANDNARRQRLANSTPNGGQAVKQ
jgi:hypothetical protein